jgi:peptidyl-prolyl cis-trans isomerase A (cyclophilin A)
MRSIILVLAMTACGSPEMEAENAELKDQVSSLKAKNKTLSTAAKKQSVKLSAAEKELGALRSAEVFESLGIGPEDKLGVAFHTSMGIIKCDLLPGEAPKTVLNFVQLAEGGRSWTHPKTGVKSDAPLYNGTIFHRVIPKFMIQGGDPMGTGRGGPGYRFEDETSPSIGFDAPGLLAMANSGPNTNGSQFFITDRSTPAHLNGKHTIFGRCENLDIIQAIASVDHKRTRPIEDVVLQRVEISR